MDKLRKLTELQKKTIIADMEANELRAINKLSKEEDSGILLQEKKITKKDLKKAIKKLFKEEVISEKRKDKLLEYIENKEYEKVFNALEKKGIVFD
jgi:hypothetical protein